MGQQRPTCDSSDVKFGNIATHCWMVTTVSLLVFVVPARSGVGDPQVRTDHLWYPGELACSTFPRLAVTQADLFERVTGTRPKTDEERVLAAWLWRNTHYWHGEQGVEDLWGRGFRNDTDTATRDYWTGLFSHGFGLCGTTHAQWIAEMEHLLGHNRARVVGVTGHNSFEVFLKGGPYRDGRWVLLDHDVSTVVFDRDGQRLLSIDEIRQDLARLTGERSSDRKRNGWLVSGLHPDDVRAFDTYRTAEYLAGYAGPPPMVHLRRGETMRRYPRPGLSDGRTFVFWGRNYRVDGVPGPERSRTWVNQPDNMYESQKGSGFHPGQARFANAVFTYAPDFTTGDYREGLIDEQDDAMTFEFQSPYVIAATPASDADWAIYQNGCRNGLILTASEPVTVSLSTDRGGEWSDEQRGTEVDLTDLAKGHRQYWLKIHHPASALRSADLRIRTVCQANSSTIPQLTDNGCTVEYASSARSLVSAGPNVEQARAHVVAGAFDSPRVTLQLAPPRSARAVEVFAAAHVASSNPPRPDVAYQVEFSVDNGRQWRSLVQDWRITRQGQEPNDFWSQSFCWGSSRLETTDAVQVRFRNDGGKRYRRAEVHLAYQEKPDDNLRVTFGWKDDAGTHTATRVFPAASEAGDAGDAEWRIPTTSRTRTDWVELSPHWR